MVSSYYTSKVLDKYFNDLKHSGFINTKTVNKLLLLVHINNILNNKDGYYLSETEYRKLSKLFSSLEGSHCLLTYEKYQSNIPKNLVPTNRLVRVTHMEDIRIMEDRVRVL